MERNFVVAPLRPSHILQAYPLVREVAPDIDVDEWRAFARAVLRARRTEGRGIVAARSGNDYLRGLFVYRIGPDLFSSRALVVEWFAVSSLFSPYGVAMALLTAAENIARRHRCRAVRAEFPTRPEWLEQMMQERGYAHSACCLSMSFRPPPPRGGHRVSGDGPETATLPRM